MTKSTNRSRKAREIANSEAGTSYQAALNRLSAGDAPLLGADLVLGHEHADSVWFDFHSFPDTNPWDRVVIGGNSPNSGVAWEPNWASDNLLVTGGVGSGKTLVADAVVLHCIQYPEWRVFLADPTGGLGERWVDARNVVATARSSSELSGVLERLRLECDERRRKMKEESVSSFTLLAEPPPALMLVVDGYEGFEGFGWGSLPEEAFVESLVSLGEDSSTRDLGVHVVLCVDESVESRFDAVLDHAEKSVESPPSWGYAELAQEGSPKAQTPYPGMLLAAGGSQPFERLVLAPPDDVQRIRQHAIRMSNALAQGLVSPAELLAEIND